MKNKISVRDLIEFTYRCGDIDQSFKSSAKQLEGQEVHRFIQNAFEEGIEAEVTLSLTVDCEGHELTISGRADGLRRPPNPCIFEIKTTKRRLDDIEEPLSQLHLFQAMLYAYMFSVNEALEEIEVELIYGQPQGKGKKHLFYHYTFADLKTFMDETLKRYAKWMKLKEDLHERLKHSADQMVFPYAYRKGQRDLSVALYRSIQRESVLMVEAPTGIGKTLSVIFPALKAYSYTDIDKIFYLTPKTTGRVNAKKALIQLDEAGLMATHVEIQAKEKLCLNDVFQCHPEVCPYAMGHYDRVNDALYVALIEERHFDVERVKHYASLYQVCPFEFVLDLSLFAALIICDYNYVWDPNVQLKRHFAEPKKHVLLVDEAHNLVERSRSMFSSELLQEDLQKAIRAAKGHSKKLHLALQKLHRLIKKKVSQQDLAFKAESEFPLWLYDGAMGVKMAFESEEPDVLNTLGSAVLDMYFSVLSYLKRLEYFGDEFLHLYRWNGRKKYSVQLFCRDAGRMIKASYSQVKTTALFSATLSPMAYFKQCFGLDGEDIIELCLGSPYAPEHLQLSIENYSTRFKDREATLQSIANCIRHHLVSSGGNSIVFFPSYDYLKQVQPYLEAESTLHLLIQSRSMPESERDLFLEAFERVGENGVTGLCVLGGVFAEGIDLKADRLSCVIIVGVGLPMINEELQLIESYYSERGFRGYDYTYTIPGMIRILQAGGRLIRDEEDRGRLVLIDDRYSQSLYKSLLPKHWKTSLALTTLPNHVEGQV